MVVMGMTMMMMVMVMVMRALIVADVEPLDVAKGGGLSAVGWDGSFGLLWELGRTRARCYLPSITKGSWTWSLVVGRCIVSCCDAVLV